MARSGIFSRRGFTPSYVQSVKKAVRRYQKERSKLIRAGVYENVPKQVSLKSLFRNYYSKRELNKQLKEMSVFTAAKALKTDKIRGKVFTKYEIERFRLQLNRQRKAIERELNLMTGFDSDSPLAHNSYIKTLEARRKELSADWRDIIATRAGREVMSHDEKSENFYENFVKALFDDANRLGFPEEKIREMVNKMNKLTPQQFYRMYHEDPNIGYIFGYYGAEVKGNGSIADTDAIDAFNDLYNKMDAIIERYKNIK